ncbi:hypothetical protein BC828DRAFT_395121 [Blastocladiella britannica]|nr:hypothetical protein BC828DRAFT_395121 [Blastocladiella britannica]
MDPLALRSTVPSPSRASHQQRDLEPWPASTPVGVTAPVRPDAETNTSSFPPASSAFASPNPAPPVSASSLGTSPPLDDHGDNGQVNVGGDENSAGATGDNDGHSISAASTSDHLHHLRSTSATLQRIAELFELGSVPTELRGQFSCWMLRNVLIRGRVYLTNSHICFHARLPTGELNSHSGFVSKKGTLAVWTSYWFVLKDTNLSLYTDAENPYYPVESIDLRSIESIELNPKYPLRLKLRFKASPTGLSVQSSLSIGAGQMPSFSSSLSSSTSALLHSGAIDSSPPAAALAAAAAAAPPPPSVVTWKLATDSPQACREWCRLLQESTFLAQNANDDIRVVLPAHAITHVAADFEDPAIRVSVAFRDDMASAPVGQQQPAALPTRDHLAAASASSGTTSTSPRWASIPFFSSSLSSSTTNGATAPAASSVVLEDYTFAYFARHEEAVNAFLPYSPPPLAADSMIAQDVRELFLADGQSPPSPAQVERKLSLRRLSNSLANWKMPSISRSRSRSASSTLVATPSGQQPSTAIATVSSPLMGVASSLPTLSTGSKLAQESAIMPPDSDDDEHSTSSKLPVIGPAIRAIRRFSHRRSHSSTIPTAAAAAAAVAATSAREATEAPATTLLPTSPLSKAVDAIPGTVAASVPALLLTPAVNRADSGSSLMVEPSAPPPAQVSTPPPPASPPTPLSARSGSVVRHHAHRKTSSLDLGRGRLGAKPLPATPDSSPASSAAAAVTAPLRATSNSPPALAHRPHAATMGPLATPLAINTTMAVPKPLRASERPLSASQPLPPPTASSSPSLAVVEFIKHPTRTVKWGAGDRTGTAIVAPEAAVAPDRPLSPQEAALEGRHPDADAFRTRFKVEDEVMASAPVYLIRTLPRYGRVYVGRKYLGYLSTAVLGLRSHITVLIPLEDVIGVAASPSSSTRDGGMADARMAERGMLVAARCAELCFEFASRDARDAVARTVSAPPKLAREVTSRARMAELAGIMQDRASRGESFFDLSTVGRELDHVPQISSSARVPSLPPRPMRIAIITIGTRGDVQPFIALSLGFMADGHSVKLCTHKEYQPWIESFGIEFAEVKGDPAEIMKLCVDYPMFSIGFVKQVFGKFRGWLAELLETAWIACQGAELIIEAAGAIGAGYHIAEKLQVPVIRAFMMPWTRTASFAHPFAPVHASGVANSIGYNYSTFVLAEQAIWSGTRSIVNHWRRKTLGLEPLWTLDFRHIPFIYGISPEVMPQPVEWPDYVHVCGYWFLPPSPAALAWKPPSDLERFLAVAPERTVYIGFGSIVVPDPVAMSQTIVAAVKRAGVRAIVCRGWSQRGTSSTSSAKAAKAAASTACDDILELDSVPHDWLFPRVRGVVHHGGSGTTAAGLRFGVPCIIKPFFGDQFFWAQRVEELGAGINLPRMTESKFAAALTTLVKDPKMAERARIVGDRIGAEDGVRAAIRAVYRDLDYAQSVIVSAAGGGRRHVASSTSAQAVMATSHTHTHQHQRPTSPPPLKPLLPPPAATSISSLLSPARPLSSGRAMAASSPL